MRYVFKVATQYPGQHDTTFSQPDENARLKLKRSLFALMLPTNTNLYRELLGTAHVDVHTCNIVLSEIWKSSAVDWTALIRGNNVFLRCAITVKGHYWCCRHSRTAIGRQMWVLASSTAVKIVTWFCVLKTAGKPQHDDSVSYLENICAYVKPMYFRLYQTWNWGNNTRKKI